MKLSKMAVWPSNNPKSMISKGVDGNDMMLMGMTVSQKTVVGVDLVQNCDLPPPVKVFTGSDNKTVISSMNRICRMMGPGDENDDEELSLSRYGGGENDKLELLKALRLSQTRAREAEKKAAILAKERDCLENALLEEAKELFAHRQLVRLLELQVSYLNSKWLQRGKQRGLCGCECDSLMSMKEGDEEDDSESITRIMSLALWLGIAGVGFVYGCRYLF